MCEPKFHSMALAERAEIGTGDDTLYLTFLASTWKLKELVAKVAGITLPNGEASLIGVPPH